ncbi:MAG: MBL fold metallo-hydrolase [Armatimonadota bacterium]
MPLNPNDILISFSLALYSQWFYHKPTRCLFDAGEGVATTLGAKVFGIRHVFLSHGHEDHIAGISNLVNIRNLASGERDKPLIIYYPKHDRWIDALLEYVERKQSGLMKYPLYAQPMEVGSEVEIPDAKRPTRVVAFEMRHTRGQLCLGYEIQQERKLPDPATGRNVCRYHPVFLYTGDGFEACHTPYGRLDMAVHEATFLGCDADLASAIESNRHATVEIAVEWGASQDVKVLILCHISDRYVIEDVIEASAEAKKKSGFRGDLYVAHCNDIIRVPCT